MMNSADKYRVWTHLYNQTYGISAEGLELEIKRFVDLGYRVFSFNVVGPQVVILFEYTEGQEQYG